MKRYILTQAQILSVFEKGRDWELHWNKYLQYPDEKGISFAFENFVPDWATHFYGGDRAYVSPARNDIYEEIPK